MRVNIEEEGIGDARKLSNFMKCTYREALGTAGALWHASQKDEKEIGSFDEIIDWADLYDVSDDEKKRWVASMVRAGLLKPDEKDQTRFVIRGNLKQIANAKVYMERSAKGGQATKEKWKKLKELEQAGGNLEEGLKPTASPPEAGPESASSAAQLGTMQGNAIQGNAMQIVVDSKPDAKAEGSLEPSKKPTTTLSKWGDKTVGAIAPFDSSNLLRSVFGDVSQSVQVVWREYWPDHRALIKTLEEACMHYASSGNDDRKVSKEQLLSKWCLRQHGLVPVGKAIAQKPGEVAQQNFEAFTALLRAHGVNSFADILGKKGA